MTRYAYAYEKLLGATEIMATGRGSRPERLARATHRYLLGIRHQQANRLPDELALQLAEFITKITAIAPPTQWDNAIDATAMRMPWQKAERLSGQLFSLFIAVSELRKAA